MRVAFYGRYSSDEQSEASIRQQFRIVREWCRTHGHTLVAYYYDRGYSGSTLNRPGMQRMLKDAERDCFDIIVTHKLNRFSRNLVDIILTINQLQNQSRSVLYASATEVFDCTSMIGKVLLVLLAFFAEWYLVELSAETARGKHDRVAAKKLQNNRPPFGYRHMGPDVSPEPNHTINPQASPATQTPAAAMAHLFELRVTKRDTGERIEPADLSPETARLLHSDSSCAAWLNQQEFKTSLGRPFSADTVGDLLSNPYFAGFARETALANGKTAGGARKRTPRRQGKLYKGAHTPLVSVELFDLVQQARRYSARKAGGQPQRTDRVYLLDNKLAICSACGQPMKCHAIYDKTGTPLAYFCAAYKRGYECSAPRTLVREKWLAPQADALIKALTLPDVLNRHVIELMNVDDEADRIRDEIAMQQKRAAALDAKLDVGRITPTAYKADMQTILDTIKRLEGKLTAASRFEPTKATATFEEYKGLVSLWEIATPEERRDVLHDLLDSVRVNVASKQIEAFKPKPDFGFLFQASPALAVEGEGWYTLRKN